MELSSIKLVFYVVIIFDILKLEDIDKKMLEHIIIQMEEESGRDRQAAMADMRFNFIENLCKYTVVKPHESKERKRSQAIDKILTGKYTAIPMFMVIMGTIFFLTFGVIGKSLSNLMDMAIGWITNICDRSLEIYGLNPIVH